MGEGISLNKGTMNRIEKSHWEVYNSKPPHQNRTKISKS